MMHTSNITNSATQELRDDPIVSVIISELVTLKIILANNMSVPESFSNLIIQNIKSSTDPSEVKIYSTLTPEEQNLLKIGCNYSGPVMPGQPIMA